MIPTDTADVYTELPKHYLHVHVCLYFQEDVKAYLKPPQLLPDRGPILLNFYSRTL